MTAVKTTYQVGDIISAGGDKYVVTKSYFDSNGREWVDVRDYRSNNTSVYTKNGVKQFKLYKAAKIEDWSKIL